MRLVALVILVLVASKTDVTTLSYEGSKFSWASHDAFFTAHLFIAFLHIESPSPVAMGRPAPPVFCYQSGVLIAICW